MSSRKRLKTEAGEEEESKTVKFNVGGKLYEVSKSLLNGFPDTVLAEKISSSSSTSSPIFIDRDPDRFTFCLDYMRDNGKVCLPETVSKLALLEELKFLGFCDVDESKICQDKWDKQKTCMARFHEITKTTKQRIARMEKDLARKKKEMEENLARSKKEIEMEKVALRCLEKSFKCDEDDFYVNHGGDCKLWADLYYMDPYFVECCDKLALHAYNSNGRTLFVRRLRTNMEGQK